MTHEIFINVLMYLGLGGLIICGVALFAVSCRDFFTQCWEMLGAKRLRTIMLVMCIGATYYGGAKHTKGTITFPQTDPDTWYLKNVGSYVTNDAVFVSMQRNLVVPVTANVFVDGLELRYTNETDWATHSFTAYSNTLAAAGTEFFVAWPYATNFNWIVYTDWVPPPVVHTNGIAYVVWQRPSVTQATNTLAMTRTGVYINDFRIAPNPAITNGPNPGVALTLTQGANDNEQTSHNH